MVEELKEEAKQFHFKTFLDDYDEFCTITGFDNVRFNEDDIRPLMKKMNTSCMGVAFLANIAAHLFRMIPLFGIRDALGGGAPFGLQLFLVALTLVGSFFIAKLWKRVASDKKEVTFGILAVLSVLLVLIIGFLVGKIF
jgi:hypothetical protein